VIEVPIEHSDLAGELLQHLGLMEWNEAREMYVPKQDVEATKILTAFKHIPPALPCEGKFSPASGFLFAATRSNHNLQFVTGYLASRYLAKYVAMVDEHNRIYINTSPSSPNKLTVDSELLYNTKITGSAIQGNKKSALQRNWKHPKGRAISLMEMLTVILGYDIVHTNIPFKHVPTVSLEERSGRAKVPTIIELKKMVCVMLMLKFLMTLILEPFHPLSMFGTLLGSCQTSLSGGSSVPWMQPWLLMCFFILLP
jgi:hypothetical protein